MCSWKACVLADKAIQTLLLGIWAMISLPEQRGEVSVAIATAKIAATNTSLYHPEYFSGDGRACDHSQTESGPFLA